MGKTRQKRITKASEHVPSTKSNGRMFLDILIIKEPKNGKKVTLRKKKQRITVDEFIGIKLSDLYKSKNSMIESKCKLFEKWEKMATR